MAGVTQHCKATSGVYACAVNAWDLFTQLMNRVHAFLILSVELRWKFNLDDEEISMQYKTLGNTGLLVSQICLGAMTFAGGEGMWKHIAGMDQAGADDLVKASVDAGVNFVDTADVYTDGQSEITLGRSLKNLGIAR